MAMTGRTLGRTTSDREMSHWTAPILRYGDDNCAAKGQSGPAALGSTLHSLEVVGY